MFSKRKTFINENIYLNSMDKVIGLRQLTKYFLIGSFFLLIILSLLLVKRYLIALISAAVLAYLFFPVYRRLNKYIKNKSIASFIVCIIILLVVIVPVLFAVNAILNESVKFFYSVKGIDIADLSFKLTKYLQNVDINFYLKEILNKISLAIMQGSSNFIISIPQKLIIVFITLFVTYYLLKEGPSLVEKLKQELPLKEKHKDELSKKLNSVVYATVYGLILTAIIQGAIGALGLWLFRGPSPVLLGIVMIILVILPVVGPALVWLPIAIIKILQGETFNGVGLLLFGLLVISTIDNVIRPKIIGKRAKIHPIVILIGVLGGLELFGIIGMVLGPLILAILTVFIDFYIQEKNEAI